MITAKVIADSTSIDSTRLVTLELCYPRYIHAEFMTHRVFSRNAQSSRAIPIERMIEDIQQNPVEPIFMKNQKGMQADSLVNDKLLISCKDEWGKARDYAIRYALTLSGLGVHKQIANRLLEPFSHIKVIVSATEWANFFRLRIAPDAQQEICELAKEIRLAIDTSLPSLLKTNEYHLPYISSTEREKYSLSDLKKMSVARCARVSYLNHDNSKPDPKKDITLHDFLLESRHASAFEHVATPSYFNTTNFRNYQQYRHEVNL